MPEDEELDDVSIEIDEEEDAGYNPEFEQLLKENGDHSQVYSILHQMSHVKYRHMYDKCNIPLIIITAVIGFVTGIGLPYANTNTALGAASVFVSIMKSIVSYLKLSERSENHRICSLQFGQISNEIKTELSLRRKQRQPAKILLDMVKVKYKNLMEVAQLLDNDVIQQFRNKYLQEKDIDKKVEVSLPPVFSSIPGIKILGADNENDHKEQMDKNLERYKAEKQCERDHIETELKHIAALRVIKDKYRVDRGKEELDPKATRPSMRSLTRQRSFGDESTSSSSASGSTSSSASSSSSSALSTIPEQESSVLSPSSPSSPV